MAGLETALPHGILAPGPHTMEDLASMPSLLGLALLAGVVLVVPTLAIAPLLGADFPTVETSEISMTLLRPVLVTMHLLLGGTHQRQAHPPRPLAHGLTMPPLPAELSARLPPAVPPSEAMMRRRLLHTPSMHRHRRWVEEAWLPRLEQAMVGMMVDRGTMRAPPARNSQILLSNSFEALKWLPTTLFFLSLSLAAGWMGRDQLLMCILL